MIFYSHANKTHFHKKGCALGHNLKVRVFGTRKWPISMVSAVFCSLGLPVIQLTENIMICFIIMTMPLQLTMLCLSFPKTLFFGSLLFSSSSHLSLILLAYDTNIFVRH